MGKVTLTGYIVVPPDDLARVLAELPNHIELTRNEPGCIAFEVTQAPSDPYRFDVAEEFQDRQAFERPVGSVQPGSQQREEVFGKTMQGTGVEDLGVVDQLAAQTIAIFI